MARSQFKSKRSVSGRKYSDLRKKRACDMAGIPSLTQIGKNKLKVKRVRGNNIKKQLLRSESVSVNIDGKVEKLNIITVENNPANIHYTRRSIITKGAVVKTEKGSVRITSRPGQSGSLFGVLI